MRKNGWIRSAVLLVPSECNLEFCSWSFLTSLFCGAITCNLRKVWIILSLRGKKAVHQVIRLAVVSGILYEMNVIRKYYKLNRILLRCVGLWPYAFNKIYIGFIFVVMTQVIIVQVILLVFRGKVCATTVILCSFSLRVVRRKGSIWRRYKNKLLRIIQEALNIRNQIIGKASKGRTLMCVWHFSNCKYIIYNEATVTRTFRSYYFGTFYFFALEKVQNNKTETFA